MSESGADIATEFGFDIQEAVKKRLALNSKKTVQLNELLQDTKFTKSEIRMMYRGFKQVSSIYYLFAYLFKYHCSCTMGKIGSKSVRFLNFTSLLV